MSKELWFDSWEGKRFTSSPSIHTGYGAHLAPCSVWIRSSIWGSSSWCVKVTAHPHIVLKLRTNGAFIPRFVFMACTWTTVPLPNCQLTVDSCVWSQCLCTIRKTITLMLVMSLLKSFTARHHLKVRITVNPVKTQQFMPLFSTTCFSLEGHHPVEHEWKNIYIQFIWNWGLKISRFMLLCGYI